MQPAKNHLSGFHLGFFSYRVEVFAQCRCLRKEARMNWYTAITYTLEALVVYLVSSSCLAPCMRSEESSDCSGTFCKKKNQFQKSILTHFLKNINNKGSSIQLSSSTSLCGLRHPTLTSLLLLPLLCYSSLPPIPPPLSQAYMELLPLHSPTSPSFTSHQLLLLLSPSFTSLQLLQ